MHAGRIFDCVNQIRVILPFGLCIRSADQQHPNIVFLYFLGIVFLCHIIHLQVQVIIFVLDLFYFFYKFSNFVVSCVFFTISVSFSYIA